MLVFIMLSCINNEVEAQNRLPSDVELRSAYCTSFINAKVASINTSVSEVRSSLEASTQIKDLLIGLLNEEIQKSENALIRLRAYLTPKIDRLDSTALIVAFKLGASDFTAHKTQGGVCNAKCKSVLELAKPEQYNNCMSQCLNPSLSKKETECIAPDWLPF